MRSQAAPSPQIGSEMSVDVPLIEQRVSFLCAPLMAAGGPNGQTRLLVPLRSARVRSPPLTLRLVSPAAFAATVPWLGFISARCL